MTQSPNADDGTPMPTSGSILEGLVVLDFTRVLAGPHCTRMLADLGARVIKIERPGEGDEMRRAPLKLAGEGDQSTYFARRNSGKESVAVDMSHPDAAELIAGLARQADIAIENFVPGVADKLQCGYDALREVKPDIIYCSISGYGQTGPYAQRGAFAHIISAASGIMSLDSDDRGPRSSHLQAADVLAGTNAFGGILAAVIRRMKTGEGARIDVSMLESLMASEDIAYGAVPNGGTATPGPRAGMGISRIGERWIAWQSGGAPMLWHRLCTVIGRPELEHDPQFSTPEARRERWSELQAIVGESLQACASADAALALLTDARIPCAAVLEPAEVVEHPQLAFRETFSDVPHRGAGSVKVTSSPYWIDGAPVKPRSGPPYQIGEDTNAVLSDLLGYDADTIAELAARGVIEVPSSQS